MPETDRSTAERHPDWCTGGPTPCGDHLGDVVNVPATLSPHVSVDGHAVFPSFDVAAVELADGRRGVYTAVYGSDPDRERWLGATFSPAEARRYATELVTKADLAERTCGYRCFQPSCVPVGVGWPMRDAVGA
jgi:hypothetical protein